MRSFGITSSASRCCGLAREVDANQLRSQTMKILTLCLVVVVSMAAASSQTSSSPIVISEFIYETAPFPSAHASTIAETSDGVLAAWFGGAREGAADVGIWAARRTNGVWTPPVEVANGVQPDGSRHPCWNPVLFKMPNGPLALFYKVGPSPRTWWGVV